MTPTFLQVASALITFQAAFFGLFLFSHRRGNLTAHKILGSFLLVVAVEYLNTLLMVSGVIERIPHLGFIGNAFGILFGTTLWLYVNALTRPEFRLDHRVLPHLIPFALMVLYSIFTYHIRDDEGMRRVLAGQDMGVANMIVLPLLGHSLIFGYLFAALRQLLRAGRAMKDHCSNIQPYQMNWLRVILGGFLIFWGFRILQIPILMMGGEVVWVEALFAIQTTIMFVFINVLLFKTMGQHPIFQDGEPAAAPQPTPAPAPVSQDPTPAKSPSSTRDPQADLAAVETAMAASHPYLDPNLTIVQLAGTLEMSPKYLSQLLNEVAGKNFFEFVNGYRIQAAAQLLDSDRKVLDIATEVGFNSKSAFNRAFKKAFNQTPTQYKKQHAPAE